ncbi:MAG TPA: TolC family protein [bacterium]|nr:TolC family protein [bacterium]
MKIGITTFITACAAALALSAIHPVAATAADIPSQELVLADSPLALDRAVETALAANRSVRSADLAAESAAQKLAETKSRFGLSLKLSGNYQRVESSSKLAFPLSYYEVAPVNISGSDLFAISNPVPKIQLIEYSLNPEWQHTGDLNVVKPVFTFGKKEKAVSAARKGKDIAALDSKLARINLAAEVKALFHGAILAGEAVKLLESSVSRSESHMKDVVELFNSGLGIKLDVIRSEVELQSAREKLATARKNRTLAMRALANIIGMPYEKELKITDRDAFENIELAPLDHYLALAARNRPEFEQIRKGRDAANLAAELEKNKPTVAFAGQWSFHSRGSMFTPQDSWRAVLAVEYPFFDQGLASAKSAQARLRAGNLDLKMDDLSNGVKIQTEAAYLQIIEAKDRLETSRIILSAAEEGYRIASLSYKEGFATQLDVIDAEHNLTSAGLNFASAKRDYETAKAGLASACGLVGFDKRPD